MHSRKISTKEGIHQAFEDILLTRGPQTCNRLVDIVHDEYTITRVNVHKDRAAQYLIQNPNIIILGDVRHEGKVHVYGLRDVEYPEYQDQVAQAAVV